MIVVKLGGAVVRQGLSAGLLEDLTSTSRTSGLVLVHGGGDEVTRVAERLGKPQAFVTSASGITSRLTDAETIEIYMMVMRGKVANEVARMLWKAGLQPITLSGMDGGLLRGVRKEKLVIQEGSGRRRIIEGGFTGTVKDVNTRLLELLVREGYTPIITPLALGASHEPLNVDGDRAASAVAGALGADYLVYFVDVPGVVLEGVVLRRVKAQEAKELMLRVGQGMRMKLLASTEALAKGVKRVVIAPANETDHPLRDSLEHRIGTLIEP
jgi:acetylglutamate/LysW-gamma-L-alpha-aminoadipate kinase